MTPTGRRKLLSSLFVAFCAGAVILALIPLAFVLFFVLTQGVRSLNIAFFTHMPTPVGEAGGGMMNSIVGTLMLSALAATMAVPIGVVSGRCRTSTETVLALVHGWMRMAGRFGSPTPDASSQR